MSTLLPVSPGKALMKNMKINLQLLLVRPNTRSHIVELRLYICIKFLYLMLTEQVGVEHTDISSRIRRFRKSVSESTRS